MKIRTSTRQDGRKRKKTFNVQALIDVIEDRCNEATARLEGREINPERRTHCIRCSQSRAQSRMTREPFCDRCREEMDFDIFYSKITTYGVSYIPTARRPTMDEQERKMR